MRKRKKDFRVTQEWLKDRVCRKAYRAFKKHGKKSLKPSACLRALIEKGTIVHMQWGDQFSTILFIDNILNTREWKKQNRTFMREGANLGIIDAYRVQLEACIKILKVKEL